MCVGLFQSQLPVPLLVKPLLLDQTFLLTVLLAQTKDLTDLFVEVFFKTIFPKNANNLCSGGIRDRHGYGTDSLLSTTVTLVCQPEHHFTNSPRAWKKLHGCNRVCVWFSTKEVHNTNK